MSETNKIDFHLAMLEQIDKYQNDYNQLEENFIYELRLSEEEIDDLYKLIRLNKIINDLGHAANSMFFSLSKKDQNKVVKLREKLAKKHVY